MAYKNNFGTKYKTKDIDKKINELSLILFGIEQKMNNFKLKIENFIKFNLGKLNDQLISDIKNLLDQRLLEWENKIENELIGINLDTSMVPFLISPFLKDFTGIFENIKAILDNGFSTGVTEYDSRIFDNVSSLTDASNNNNLFNQLFWDINLGIVLIIY